MDEEDHTWWSGVEIPVGEDKVIDIIIFDDIQGPPMSEEVKEKLRDWYHNVYLAQHNKEAVNDDSDE